MKEAMYTPETHESKAELDHIFSGNMYLFHAFDVGDDINLDRVKEFADIRPKPLKLSKYFKNYHIPLAVELPQEDTFMLVSSKIHNFGAISLTYRIPFRDTFENIRKHMDAIDNKYREQSIENAGYIFKRIKDYINKPKFFHTRSSYPVIQVDPDTPELDVQTLKKVYGGVIASTVRFETQTLSEHHKNHILDSAIGYFRGDLIVIDTEAAFVYDKEYEDTLDFFEFANIQHLELKYFDRLLNKHLNMIYEERVASLPLKSYLPFIGTHSQTPLGDLDKLRVDISVIVERLQDNIKLQGEAYFTELYSLLVEKRDLKNLRDAIHTKLSIIKDVQTVYRQKIDAIREDSLSILIIILIFIELIIGILQYLR